MYIEVVYIYNVWYVLYVINFKMDINKYYYIIIFLII